MDKTKVLFVCLGNICRSPSAEAVMKALVEKKGLDAKLEIDSAGTAGYHSGEPADQRMQRHAVNRNYNLTSISRKVNAKVDFDYFDFIVAMDDQNVEDLEMMAQNDEQRAKISKMTDYCRTYTHTSVPDPYYGGAAGFELVLDLLEDACEGLIEHIENA
ncbi:low molecular weight protein-tyrosine-phosphatase [Carboxylicivirga linearis]|uniref:Low molecular weight phosphotyrosine protein phosphatase n=1 Tax=Carboxylicivirga linearis TaxID=1628157 RepID=A0ABS5JZ99_9BACT|nr:low molecular weight protein-tyrosine-phosphatase [Carboxylicivirga linearis]MBS2100223.1 low molecular weight phosphotyrosine protein phosphatase [Carboxylicivirga linearis]